MVYPESSGQALKKAIQWVAYKKKEQNSFDNIMDLANEAAFRFDLTPKDSEFLIRFVKEDQES